MRTEAGRPPVVFAFKIDGYEVAETREEIKNWEKQMKDAVGFSGDLVNLAGTCCESTSGGRKDDCDQD